MFAMSIASVVASTEFNALKYRQDFMTISTVQLETEKPSGKFFGTGFFYKIQHPNDPKRYQVVIMTNKHVLENASRMIAVCPLAENGVAMRGTNVVQIVAEQPYALAYKHPDNGVDLCAIPITALLEGAQKRGRTVLYAAYTRDLLADDKCFDKLRQLDTVIMIGYPSCLKDEVNQQPIFRTGTLATNPSLDFKGRSEFVLDIPNYGGSSGSPVVLFDEGKYWSHEGYNNAALVMGSRFKLLGVNYAHYTATSPGCAIVPGQNQGALPVVSKIPNNTALVIKASRIRELENEIIKIQ